MPLAGLEVLTLGLIDQFLKYDLEIDLVLINESEDFHQYLDRNVKVFNFQSKRLLKCISPLKNYIDDEKPDAIFAALWPLTSIVGIAHKLSGSNSILIFSDHNPLSEQYYYFNFIQTFCMRIFTNITYRLADYHVSVSNDIRNDLNKYFKLSGPKFVVINNLVTFPKSSSLNSNDSGDLDRIKNFQGYKILSVGQMKEQKNHKLLIDAFKIVTQSYKAILIIVGSGEMYKETKQYVEANNLFNQVLLPGHSSRITEYYKNADLFALSSKYEGFGNVLIEALHFGLPIVSTNCSGGPKEILCDNEYGILVKNYSPQELATGIIQILSGKKFFNKDVLINRAEDFSPEKIAAKYLNLIDNSH